MGGGLAAQQWTVDAYLLTLGSLLPAAGSLSDLFGRKRVLALGLAAFGAASLLCALAPSLWFLVAARALQGASGALLVPSSLALIVATFRDAAQKRAIATWTAWSGIATIAGPLAGGVLVDAASWRWVFAMNLLPVAVTLLVVAALERDRRPAERRKVDATGAGLCAVGVGGVMFALIEEPLRGFGDPAVAFSLAGGTLAFVAFIAYERRTRAPMIDLTLFRRRNFAVGNAATFVVYAGLSCVGFLVSVFLQQVAGYSATAAGLALVPVTLLLFVFSPIAGRIAEKHGPRWPMAIGPVMAAVGVALMARVGAEAHYASELLPGVLVFGLGLSTTVAPLTAAVLGDVEEAQAGIGSAVNNAVARIASLFAIAAIGALSAERFASAIDEQPAAGRTAHAREFLAAAKPRALDTTVPPELGAEAAELEPLLVRASVRSFHAALFATAALLFAGGVISAVGITNAQRRR